MVKLFIMKGYRTPSWFRGKVFITTPAKNSQRVKRGPPKYTPQNLRFCGEPLNLLGSPEKRSFSGVKNSRQTFWGGLREKGNMSPQVKSLKREGFNGVEDTTKGKGL